MYKYNVIHLYFCIVYKYINLPPLKGGAVSDSSVFSEYGFTAVGIDVSTLSYIVIILSIIVL